MIKLKLFLSVLFLSSITYIYGQFGGVVLHGKLTSIDISVNLFKNRKFFIELLRFSDGDVFSHPLSIGNYYYNKDTLILRDTYYKYTLKFIRNKNTLTPVKTYSWLHGLKLTSYIDDYSTEYKDYAESITNYYSLPHYQRTQRKYRLYYREYATAFYSLVLLPGNLYKCKIDNLVISEGRFVYNGNFIQFFDNHLGFSFKSSVNEYEICMGFMPFKDVCFRFSPPRDIFF
jgi:hypothetical protein